MAYGEIFQLGYVVPDLDAALAHWTGRMGVGPFFLYPTPLQFVSLSLRGVPLDDRSDVIRRVAVGYAGDMMIELIEPGATPSIYTEFVDAGLSGVQHLGAMAESVAATRDRMVGDGAVVVWEGRLTAGEFCYLDVGEGPLGSPLYELMNASDERRNLYARMKQAAIDWDGSDPVRQFASLGS